ncbi:sulfurtransferase TusA family protein [Bisgaard Taxon 10/6]|uniref:Sulfurtransferase TusA family protein n=1 Tax=Exercitatus varius TaxID=67857 RepID=A0AAW6Q6U6_9PAST|nr:sulfurtransferase TusA family protein [Exercitatus varius]MDG2914692.1 sulfurtransferase TusA family protein [Exercitatus varius]MDG2917151.1 sulfurtransferase TusA family protein [Exercitatus varius]MDG2949274.1 sulfurtransferase TusA family protein [Exercitatus varius]QOF68225.1 sulfurtransferase TusA family protein [Actinobacillus sp. GY-402]
MDYQSDLREYLCPLPLIMAKQTLTKLARGDRLTLLMNHSTALQDMELLCEQQNCSLTLLENTDAHLKLRIQKLSDGNPA